MHLGLPSSLKRAVADLMMFMGKSIALQHVHMKQQAASNDCGLFALATATAISNDESSPQERITYGCSHNPRMYM